MHHVFAKVVIKADTHYIALSCLGLCAIPIASAWRSVVTCPESLLNHIEVPCRVSRNDWRQINKDCFLELSPQGYLYAEDCGAPISPKENPTLWQLTLKLGSAGPLNMTPAIEMT